MIARVIGWSRDLQRQIPALPQPFWTIRVSLARVRPKLIEENDQFFNFFRPLPYVEDCAEWQEAHKAVWPCGEASRPVFILNSHVFDWLDANVPVGDWSYEMVYELVSIGGEIKFRSKEKAALFKLFLF